MAPSERQKPPLAQVLLPLAMMMLLLSGCSQGPETAVVPSLSPDEAAQRAMAEYDTNPKDGLLDADELKRCPALRDGLESIDSNKDGRISAQEIADRLTKFQATKIGLVGVPCRVLLDDAPLEGATVTLVPEKFMGPSFQAASGISDERGSVRLIVPGQTAPGVQWGYYRIEVSKKDAAGQEQLPARYNTATTLGVEVAADGRKILNLKLVSD
jgi:hypothetical protein